MPFLHREFGESDSDDPSLVVPIGRISLDFVFNRLTKEFGSVVLGLRVNKQRVNRLD